MPSVHSSPFYQMENPAIISLLRHHHHQSQHGTPSEKQKKSTSKPSSSSSSGGGFMRMLKLFPMLTSGCKMVALLGGRAARRPLLKDKATTGTIFGYRKGRVSLAVQEDPHCVPVFVIELPLNTAEMQAEEGVRIALESETRTQRKKLMEEFVWAVYCNGRKVGYSIRRMHMTGDELHVMQTLRGVSMGAGVLPAPDSASSDGDLTYVRARFDRVVGSKDSEALYMINPDGNAGPELSIFFLRSRVRWTVEKWRVEEDKTRSFGLDIVKKSKGFNKNHVRSFLAVSGAILRGRR